ncbi:hypothetical protein ACMFMG_001340 [Clarireedia jacksonii]
MAHDNDPNFLLAEATILPVLCIVVITLRFYARRTQKAKIGPDDWLALVGALCTIILGVLLIIGVKKKAYGYPTINEYQGLWADKLEYPFLWTQISAIGCIKLSFVFFYRRIFVVSSKRNAFSIATIVVIVIVSLWTVSFVFAHIFECGTRFWALWNFKNTRLYCDKTLKMENGLAISDFITDVIVFMMPVPMVMRLHMNSTRKLAVLAIFAFGVVALASSLVRMILFIHLTKLAAGTKVDNNLIISRGLYWGLMEAGLATIGCCLPTLHALLIKSSIESIVRSIRSVVSLQSMNSHTSKSTKRFKELIGETPDGNDAESIAARSPIVLNPANPTKVESVVMGNISKKSSENYIAENEIWVNSRLEQVHNAV